jgi:hypothetical protein
VKPVHGQRVRHRLRANFLKRLANTRLRGQQPEKTGFKGSILTGIQGHHPETVQRHWKLRRSAGGGVESLQVTEKKKRPRKEAF